jgi:hypothetical protein
VPAFTYVGVAPRADLGMVNTDFTTTGVLDGVAYLFGLATQRGQNAVVNLSLGDQFGPHDGTSAIEAGTLRHDGARTHRRRRSGQ